MSCAHALAEGNESCFSIDASSITFGPGALAEAGERARELGCRRVALFTDPSVARLASVAEVRRSLGAAGVDVEVYEGVRVEPTDQSFLEAARFAREGRFDGYVSVGGGSVIDTCKGAALYATYPADFLAYVNRPIGEGRAVPGPLPPHLACPTTCGTGAECTGIAVFDLLSAGAKTGIASRRLRPSAALVDPRTTASLPAEVVAASGFDVLCHALESYTARPFGDRPRPASPGARPMSQGRNPWSDVGSLEALSLCGRFFERAVRDAADREAREAMSWAASLAGVAFGNSGVHLPHGMSYAVAGLVRDYHAPGYPAGEPMVPHGVSVVVNAPSVFRLTAAACPERHLEAATKLGADPRGAAPADAGEIVAGRLIALMRATGVPSGVAALGYGEADLDALAERAALQERLTANAPLPVGRAELAELFRGAMAYW
ncbi:MAG: iron-containing alcohol dehydrogenase [Polyangiaceae bacterium]|jgi:alcohol dehydrogenase class IV|nr:iron-containing alcohol dehydrogenase [Polyangiaceae bacterium]